jgi:hypothetical protein
MAGLTIRCNYCKRIAYWLSPSTGVQICSSCKDLTDREQWALLRNLFFGAGSADEKHAVSP